MTGRPAYNIVRLHDATDPDYRRVARTLDDAELEDEILGGRGEAAYQLALLAEAERRATQEGDAQ